MGFKDTLKMVWERWKENHRITIYVFLTFIALAVICNVIGIFDNHVTFLQCLIGIGYSLIVILSMFLFWFGMTGYIGNDRYYSENSKQAMTIYCIALFIGIAIFAGLSFYMNFQFSKFITPNP